MSDEYFQRASELKDYPFDWGAVMDLDSDQISTSTFSVQPTGLTIDTPAPTKTAITATVWCTGGTPGQTYKVWNSIVTVAGRKYTDFIRVRIHNTNE
jgi:hypothetical protein